MQIELAVTVNGNQKRLSVATNRTAADLLAKSEPDGVPRSCDGESVCFLHRL